MRNITIIYDGSHYLYRWLKPLMWAKNEFLELGYSIHYSSYKDFLPIFKKGEKLNLKKAMTHNYDIVMLAFHHSTSYLCTCSKSERIDILQKIKQNCRELIWLDTADSTGTCMFDVMPVVDLYLKKQILKDTKRYLSPIWGGRTFCEYYHTQTGLEDEQLKQDYSIIDIKDINKIRLSWNVGMGDLFAKGKSLLLHPFSIMKPDFICPNSKIKNMDLHFRGSGWSPIAGYQRTKCKELVSKLNNISHPDVNSKIPYKEYVKEIKKAKMVLSPFGWGEICTRDFEAFAYGATLIKPSMEHSITYPNWYIPNETYIPLNWNFDNFYSIIENKDIKLYREIAQNGFNMFHYYRTSNDAKKEFAEHVIKSITEK